MLSGRFDTLNTGTVISNSISVSRPSPELTDVILAEKSLGPRPQLQRSVGVATM
jgi:hypothetical protein